MQQPSGGDSESGRARILLTAWLDNFALGRRNGPLSQDRQPHLHETRPMNLNDLQAELRHFAAERDWQPFHTPKNLSTALMVEAAELAEIFQWMTPEQSRKAMLEPEAKARVAEEVADVLLYLLQVADHCQIDIIQAAMQKLARNAQKYPATRTIDRG
jgi:NTP pyrophosphatase (non-canonical NTP hydrolase)